MEFFDYYRALHRVAHVYVGHDFIRVIANGCIEFDCKDPGPVVRHFWRKIKEECYPLYSARSAEARCWLEIKQHVNRNRHIDCELQDAELLDSISLHISLSYVSV
jgi:hypothetical protein